VSTVDGLVKKPRGPPSNRPLAAGPRPVGPYAPVYGPAFDRAAHRSVADRTEALTGPSDR
jgi:hypothetical protein